MAKKINLTKFRSQMNKLQREAKRAERKIKQNINL